MQQVVVDVGVADLVEEKSVVDRIEGLADVDADGGGAQRGFPLVEAVGDTRDSREESSYARVGRAETMLSRGRGERRGNEGKDKTFEDFRDRAEERDRAVRLRVKREFLRFGDRDD